MDPGPNTPCPCGSGSKYKRCCRPLHKGAAAPTPEALMRSRYAAYDLGLVVYLIQTTHPDSPHREADEAAWADDLRAYCAATRFLGLTVQSAETRGDTGVVTFRALWARGGDMGALDERSTFYRVGGRWLYHDGVKPRATVSGGGAEP